MPEAFRRDFSIKLNLLILERYCFNNSNKYLLGKYKYFSYTIYLNNIPNFSIRRGLEKHFGAGKL